MGNKALNDFKHLIAITIKLRSMGQWIERRYVIHSYVENYIVDLNNVVSGK